MKLLTAEEVAQVLRISKYRVYELVRRGLIPSVRLGERQIRFDESRLLLWIEQGGSNTAEINA